MNAELFRYLLDEGATLHMNDVQRELLSRFYEDRYASSLIGHRMTLESYVEDLDKLDHIFSSYKDKLEHTKIELAAVEYKLALYVKEFLEAELDS